MLFVGVISALIFYFQTLMSSAPFLDLADVVLLFNIFSIYIRQAGIALSHRNSRKSSVNDQKTNLLCAIRSRPDALSRDAAVKHGKRLLS